MGTVIDFPSISRKKFNFVSVDDINKIFVFDPLVFQTTAIELLCQRSTFVSRIDSNLGERFVPAKKLLLTADKYLFDLGYRENVFHFVFKDGSEFKVYCNLSRELADTFLNALLKCNDVNEIQYRARCIHYSERKGKS